MTKTPAVTADGAFGAAFLEAVQIPAYGCFGCGDPVNYEPATPAPDPKMFGE